MVQDTATTRPADGHRSRRVDARCDAGERDLAVHAGRPRDRCRLAVRRTMTASQGGSMTGERSEPAAYAITLTEVVPADERVVETPIDELLSRRRVIFRLRYAGIHTVEGLLALSEDDIKSVPNLGLHSYAHIRERLISAGLPAPLPARADCPADDRGAPRMDTPVADLGLPAQLSNALRRSDVETFGDLVQNSEAELRALRGIGAKSSQLLREFLLSLGVQPRSRSSPRY